MNEFPSCIDLALLYTEKDNKGTRFDRDELILKTIGESSNDFQGKIHNLENIVKMYDLPSKLKLEAEVGKFRFFSFVD